MYKVRHGTDEKWKLPKQVDPEVVAAYWDKMTARTGITQRAWLDRIRFTFRAQLADFQKRKRRDADDKDGDYKPPGV